MIRIGIDPGKRGAVCALGPHGAAVRLLATCYAGPDLVPALLVAALHDVRQEAGGGAKKDKNAGKGGKGGAKKDKNARPGKSARAKKR